MKNKPKYLYRGIKIKYDQLPKFKFYGIDIELPYEPYVDSLGRKTVSDGNEYGIYMSDNETMVHDAYCNCEIMDGSPLEQYDSLGINTLRIPAIGIIYKIDTNNLEVRQPWITSYLNGHYNNNYHGHEWIADKIPARNYTIMEIVIGPDLLHDSETIKVTNLLAAEQTIKKTIEKRKKRLELLADVLRKLPSNIRQKYLDDYRKLYKDLFGQKGVKYCNIDSIRLNTAMDYIKYLLAVVYKENPENLDYKKLSYIEILKSKLKEDSSITDLEVLIKLDVIANRQAKKRFIDSKKQFNTEINTSYYDRLEELYNHILKLIKDKKDSLLVLAQIEPEETYFLRELNTTYQRYLNGTTQPNLENQTEFIISPERIEYLRQISIDYGINFDELFYELEENSEMIQPETISDVDRPRRTRI